MNETPWVWTDAEFAEEQGHADDWWGRSTPQDKFALWCEIAKTHPDPEVEVMSQMAEHFFALMVKRFPHLPIRGA